MLQRSTEAQQSVDKKLEEVRKMRAPAEAVQKLEEFDRNGIFVILLQAQMFFLYVKVSERHVHHAFNKNTGEFFFYQIAAMETTP